MDGAEGTDGTLAALTVEGALTGDGALTGVGIDTAVGADSTGAGAGAGSGATGDGADGTETGVRGLTTDGAVAVDGTDGAVATEGAVTTDGVAWSVVEGADGAVTVVGAVAVAGALTAVTTETCPSVTRRVTPAGESTDLPGKTEVPGMCDPSSLRRSSEAALAAAPPAIRLIPTMPVAPTAIHFLFMSVPHSCELRPAFAVIPL